MRSSKTLRVADLLVFVVLGACAAGCSRSSLTIAADKSYDGRTLNLRVGDGVKLSLPENPTTGYRWEFLAKPEPVCVIVSDGYVASGGAGGGGAVGSGGTHEWMFRAVSKGTGGVSLAHRRPWEKDVAPAQTFTLTVVSR
jgi:inhibitor of cysteine peptidase